MCELKKATHVIEISESNDEKHRYFYKKTWGDGKKPLAMIIMYNPTVKTNEGVLDTSIMYFNNYIYRKNRFDGFIVVNLFSKRSNKSNELKPEKGESNKKIEFAKTDKTDEWIEKAIKQSDKKSIHIAWGTNYNRLNRVREIIALLLKHQIDTVQRLEKKCIKVDNKEVYKRVHPAYYGDNLSFEEIDTENIEELDVEELQN